MSPVTLLVLVKMKAASGAVLARLPPAAPAYPLALIVEIGERLAGGPVVRGLSGGMEERERCRARSSRRGGSSPSASRMSAVHVAIAQARHRSSALTAPPRCCLPLRRSSAACRCRCRPHRAPAGRRIARLPTRIRPAEPVMMATGIRMLRPRSRPGAAAWAARGLAAATASPLAATRRHRPAACRACASGASRWRRSLRCCPNSSPARPPPGSAPPARSPAAFRNAPGTSPSARRATGSARARLRH